MAKVTSKLQVTLPKRIAEKHSIAPGDEIRFESTGSTITIVPERLAAQMQLSKSERLRLFDAATHRAEQRARKLPASTAASGERDWRRDDLYGRGPPR